MIKATLIGGPFEGESLIVENMARPVVLECQDGTEHAYFQIGGSCFTTDQGGRRSNEEAYFYHAELAVQGTVAATGYAEAHGF